jgi:hypothetical protein
LQAQSIWSSEVDFSDGARLWLEIPAGITVTTAADAFPVTTVPLPGALGFMGVGLAGLRLFARRPPPGSRPSPGVPTPG